MKINNNEKLVNWVDRFRYSVHSGIIGACTSFLAVLGNQLAEGGKVEVSEAVIVSTIVVFLVHYSKESKSFIQEKIDLAKKRVDS